MEICLEPCYICSDYDECTLPEKIDKNEEYYGPYEDCQYCGMCNFEVED